MTQVWLLVETLGDQPVVVAQGQEMKDFVPVPKFLRRDPNLAAIQNAISDLEEKPEFKGLGKPDREAIVLPLLQEIDKLKEQRFIARIQVVRTTALDKLYPEQLTRLMELAAPKPKKGEAEEPKVQYIKRSQVSVAFAKSELRTEDDVEAYVEALGNELKEQIRKNRRIVL